MIVYVSRLDKDYYEIGEKAVAYQHKPVMVETMALDIHPQQIVMNLGANRVLIQNEITIKRPATV